MARRYTSRRRATRSRSAAPRTGYRSRAVRSRRSTRTTRGRSTGTRAIRIEVVTVPQSPVARPEIGLKAAPAPRKATF